jgi:hypothetical protein
MLRLHRVEPVRRNVARILVLFDVLDQRFVRPGKLEVGSAAISSWGAPGVAGLGLQPIEVRARIRALGLGHCCQPETDHGTGARKVTSLVPKLEVPINI